VTNQKLEVIRSPYIGYCFGVKRAMGLVENGLITHRGRLFSIGDVIHNPQAVAELKAKGVLAVASMDEIGAGDTLIIRAHGVHPSIIARAIERGINVIDTTCPFVQKSQEHVSEMSRESGTIIIIGDSDHPEVQGISGHAGRDVIIIDSVEKAEKTEPGDDAGLVIQTTFPRERAMRIISVLEGKFKHLQVHDTICQATALRLEATMKIAGSVDMILVVGGRGSSNTRQLYNSCLDKGIRAHFIETADEIEDSWFEGISRVGLTTGTSTPDRIIDEVVERLEEISLARVTGKKIE